MTISPIDHHTTEHGMHQAYWLCKAAELAYEDESAIRTRTGEWGFDRFRFFHTSHEESFPLDDTQAYVAASDNMIIVVFRGTEPTNIRDWLSDVNAPAAPGPAQHGMVHLGFSQALDSVYPDVRDAIEEYRTDEQTLWITGHSLGGALAVLLFLLLVALGQAFFSLSIGMGAIMAYGAYLPQETSIANASVTVVIADTSIALLSALVIFPIVFANDLSAAQGPGLVFVTLPLAFGNMAGGLIFGTLFFCPSGRE